jgi:hypothetical protein
MVDRSCVFLWTEKVKPINMKENIKIALLAIIAVTLAANTYLNLPSGEVKKSTPVAANVDPHAGHDHASHAGNDHDDPFKLTSQPEVPAGPTTNMTFEKSSYDFGKIKQDTQNKYKFKFKNTGSNPLIIENATGSCGCTVPEYPKEPIPPGGSGEITVEYSPGKQQGAQTKTVTITANTEPRQIQLNISANVEEVN